MSESLDFTGSSAKQKADIRIVLVFLLVPLCVVAAMSGYGLLLEQDFRREQARSELEQDLARLTVSADPAAVLGELGRNLHQELHSGRVSAEEIQRLRQRDIASLPFALHWYLFDDAGRLATPDTIDLPLRREIQQAWDWLTSRRTADRLLARLTVRFLFGHAFDSGVLKRNAGESVWFHGDRGRGLLLYCPAPPVTVDVPDRRDSLFVIWESLTPLKVLESTAFRRLHADRPRMTLVAAAPGGSTTLFDDGEVHDGESLPAGLVVAPEEDLPPGVIRVTQRSGEVTFHALRRVPETDLGDLQRILFWTFVGLGILVVSLLSRIRKIVAVSFVSIRWKVPLFFLYSLLIPLSGLAILGNQTLHDRWTVLAAEIHQKALDHLSQLDRGFQREHAHVLASFRRFRETIRRAPDLPTLASEARHFDKTEHFNWIEVRDGKAALLFTNENPDLTRRIGIIATTIAKDCIERFLAGRRPDVGPQPLKPAEVFVQGFFLSPAAGWPRVLQRPDVLHPLRSTNDELFYYWDILASATTSAAMVQGDVRVPLLRETYLRRSFPQRTGVGHGAFRLAAWNEEGASYLPAGLKPGSDLVNLFKQVQSAREPVRAMVREGGEEFLATAIPGRGLDRYQLVALYPRSELDREVRKITRWVNLGAIGICLLVLAIGLTLTGSFLRPLLELTGGVRALRDRDPSHRVLFTQQDELGDLALVFNQTLDSLKEILLAHTVQAQLIPRVAPHIPGYKADLVSIPACDLGGDYCDIVPLPGDRFLMVIGDATGHGVSSALVMTMAKAGVLDFLDRDLPLVELPRRLNLLYHRFFRRTVVMTMFVAILEPATGHLEYVNAGHPFPLLVRPDGEVTRLGLPHPPLGFSARTDRLAVAETCLGHGDLLVLFTDLLMEMQNAAGQAWGPKNLIDFTREHRGDPAEKIRDAFLDKARTYTGLTDENASFEDDFTIVVLKRDAGTTGEAQ